MTWKNSGVNQEHAGVSPMAVLVYQASGRVIVYPSSGLVQVSGSANSASALAPAAASASGSLYTRLAIMRSSTAR